MSEEDKSYALKQMHDRNTFLNKQIKEKDKEIERLNKEIETLKQPQVFIDTQNMEERYGEELYKEYLEKENKRLNNIINEALGIANERVNYYHHINNKEQLEDWEDIFNALVKRDSDKE